MMNFRSVSIFVASLILLGLQSSYANVGDEELLQARAAYDRKNVIALSDYAQQLQSDNYILAPYAEYWLLLLNLEESDNKSVTDFLNNYSEFPFADRMRGEYLKKLGKLQDWQNFNAEIVNYQLEDAAVACYAAEARAVAGDDTALEAAKSLWLQAKEQPSNCNSLYDRMQAAKALTDDDIWARMRMALAESRLTLAKGIARRARSYDANQAKWLDKAYSAPQQLLSKKSASFQTKFGREINLFALNRLAKTNSTQALVALYQVEDLMQPEDINYFYGRLGLYAAQRHESQAVQWFKLADNTALDKEQLAWFARAALLNNNWPTLLNAVAKMSPVQAEEGAWRYWKARALKAQKKNVEANALFSKLATERHFYGWLAQDELKDFVQAPLIASKAKAIDIDAIGKIPAVQRAEALLRVDLRYEAKTEWIQTIKDYDDNQLLAAAEFAAKKQWFDLAINTADKTTQTHNFALRYPAPYRDLMKPAASQQGIDEAWVYGITRQESRFMHYAKSGVGAAGLMQLMPATAKWAASRAGIENYNRSMLHDLDTNIALGTYYMRYTLGLMNGQATMATAAYNAGPNRAKKWMAATPLEGAIYAENIPFTETRLYVQKVMANAHLYAQLLGLKNVPLKQRLGTIPANALANDVTQLNNGDITAEPLPTASATGTIE
jgi:soluble lytic murein transglycosylase